MIRYIITLIAVFCFIITTMLQGGACMICSHAVCGIEDAGQPEKPDCSQCESCCPAMSRCAGMKCEPIMPPDQKPCQTFYDPEDFIDNNCDCNKFSPNLISIFHQVRYITTFNCFSECDILKAHSIGSDKQSANINPGIINLHNTIPITILLL